METEALIAVGVFVGILSLTLVVMFFQGRRSSAEAAREVLKRMGRPSEEDVESMAITRKARRKDADFLGALFAKVNLIRKLEEHMWQAGLYMRVSEVLLIMLLLFGAGATAGLATWGDLLLGSAAGLALACLPVLYIHLRRKHRLKAFGLQLPEVLNLLKSSLEAGHSLLRGMQVVVEEFGDPAHSEFQMVLEQTRLGVPLPRAFEDMLKRLPEESLRYLVVALKVQAEVGSSLAEVVGRLSETIRTRQRVQLQIRALTAQPRMSGMIVGLMPLVVLGAFSLIQPGYAHTLFYDPLGSKLLKIAVGLDVAAFVVIRKVIQLDF